jgi:hypothetical protein
MDEFAVLVGLVIEGQMQLGIRPRGLRKHAEKSFDESSRAGRPKVFDLAAAAREVQELIAAGVLAGAKAELSKPGIPNRTLRRH